MILPAPFPGRKTNRHGYCRARSWRTVRYTYADTVYPHFSWAGRLYCDIKTVRSQASIPISYRSLICLQNLSLRSRCKHLAARCTARRSWHVLCFTLTIWYLSYMHLVKTVCTNVLEKKKSEWQLCECSNASHSSISLCSIYAKKVKHTSQKQSLQLPT